MKNLKQNQRGASLFGLLFIGGILVFVGIVGAQVLPTFTEYQTIGKAVDKARLSGTAADIRSTFDKAAQIDDIKSITGKDLEVTKEGEKTVVSFSYNKEIHLAGPAYLLLKYAGRSK
jgi:hypothetical protein